MRLKSWVLVLMAAVLPASATALAAAGRAARKTPRVRLAPKHPLAMPPIIRIATPPPAIFTPAPTTPIQYGEDVSVEPSPATAPVAPLDLPLVRQSGLAKVYPKSLRRKGAAGWTELRLELDPEGRVKRCDISEPSGTSMVDAAACTWARSARFASLPDATHDSLPLAIAWSADHVTLVRAGPTTLASAYHDESDIDGDDYPAEASATHSEGSVMAAVLVSSEGKALGCRIAETSGNWFLDNATCRGLMRMRYGPARDGFGRPVTDRLMRRVVWKLGEE